MKTLNHECYVSLEVAKLLKEAGFDWECCYCYDAETKDFLDDNEGEFNFNEGDDNNFYSAPTIDVAQRWLREVKDVEVEIHWTVGEILAFGDRRYSYHIESDTFKDSNDRYVSYEEALEAGIKKALEIILEKGE